MINLSPRDLSLSFGSFLQGRFGDLDLKIQPVEGSNSPVAIHGIYSTPNVSSIFSAEYSQNQRQLRFGFEIMTPVQNYPSSPFWDLACSQRGVGLSRILGVPSVNETVEEGSYVYRVYSRILREQSHVHSINEIHQDVYEFLVKDAFRSLARARTNSK